MPTSGRPLVKASILLSAFLVLVFVFSSGASALSDTGYSQSTEGTTTGTSTADWTVLIYMDADNNLEPYMIDNFLELAQVGGNADVNIVVQMDRISGYDYRYGDWRTCYRFNVTAGMTPTADNALAGQDLGEVNMGDGDTFASFIEWGVTNYPAERYIVVLKDHGASWYGCCQDETSSGDIMKLGEVQQGFDEFITLTGEPIDLVIFDDCLMGSVEVAAEYPGMMEYAVVSESQGWTNNFDYEELMTYLEATPSRSTASLATGIVNMMHLVDDSSAVTQSAAAYNMTKVLELRILFENYCVDLSRCYNSTSAAGIRQARSLCTEIDFIGTSSGDLYGIVDLYQFVSYTMTYCDDASLDSSGSALLSFLGPSGGSSASFIMDERHTATCSFCHGMSVYMPDDIDDWRSYMSSYATVCYCGSTSVYGDLLWNMLLPYTSVSLSGTTGDDGWYTTSVSATMSASSGTSIKYTYYSLDGGSWTKYTGAISVAGEGAHTLQYRSTDNYNNVENTRTLTIKIDSIAPTVSSNVVGNTVTITSNDATSGVAAVYYRIDGGSWTAYTGTMTLPDSVSDRLVEFYAEDAAGNPSSVSSVTVIGEDNLAPVTSAGASGTSGSNGWYTSSVAVSLYATDLGTGVLSTNYSVDGGTWTDYISAFTISSEGVHTVEFRSTDNRGNLEEIKSITVKIDKTAPSAWHTLSGNDLTIGSSDACSGISSVVYRVDGSDWILYTGTFTAGETGWIHDIEYFALDKAGNPSVTGTLTIGTVDGFAPVTASTLKGSAGTNGWYLGSVRVSLSATDEGGSGVKVIHYSLDGSSWFAYTTTLQITASGNHSVRYYSEDNYGNIEPIKSVSVNVDLVAPMIAASVSGGSGTYHNGTVTVSFNLTDALSGAGNCYYRMNHGSWVSASSFSLGSEGTFFVEFYGTDLAGNSAEVQSFTVVIDTTAPSTSMAMSGTDDDGWGNATSLVNVTATDERSGIAAIMYRINGGNWTEYLSAFGFDADGTYLVESYAVDMSGNFGPVRNITCTIDSTAPDGDVRFAGLEVEGSYVNNVTLGLVFSDAGSGLGKVYYLLDDGDWMLYNGSFTVSAIGLHTVSCYAVDGRGNKGVAEDTNFTVVFATVPGQVVDLKVTEADGSLLLNWSLLDDGGLDSSYHIYRASGDGEFVLIATVDEQQYIDQTAEKGVDYTYSVTAVNELGQGLASSSVDGAIESSGGTGMIWILVITAVAIVAVIAIVLVVRRRK